MTSQPSPERQAEIDAWREAQLAKAPPPTEEQIRTLAAVLARPVGGQQAS